MKKAIFSRTIQALFCSGLLLQGAVSYAADTDIFFAQASAEVRPNIFFLLDDSVSMGSCLLSDLHPAGPGCPGSDKRSRIEVLKEVMNEFLGDLEDNKVNVGLMSLDYFEHDLYSPGKGGSGHPGWECRTEFGGYYVGGVCPPGKYPRPIWKEDKKPRFSVPVTRLNNAVRTKMKNTIDSISAGNMTPTTISLYDAARYLTDIPGKHNAWAINPATSPSPITEECQPTHLVLLTDGYANTIPDVEAIKALTGQSCFGDEACSILLADWMNTTDHSPLQGHQSITTHTIGFALYAMGGGGAWIKNYLQSIAKAGSGLHRAADKADELLQVFNEILSSALQTPSASMVNPSVPRNTFSPRQENKKEVYFPLFKPGNTAFWNGNLKRYGWNDSSPPLLVDAAGAGVLDAAGEIKPTARSWWSADADGEDAVKGGVNYKLSTALNRKTYTYLGDLPPGSSPVHLAAAGHALEAGNPAITHTILGVQKTGQAGVDERKAILDFAKKSGMGAPLHSSPVVFSYDTNSQMAVIATNQGMCICLIPAAVKSNLPLCLASC